MSERPVLSELSEEEREQAFERFQILQPFLEGHTSLSQIADQSSVTLRTLQRWVRNYRDHGLAGLAHKRRSDRQMRRMSPKLVTLIEGLALQKTRPSAAAIHRQVVDIAREKGWQVPSYSCVYDIVRQIDPALVMLAHEGHKAYQDTYDLLYRRETTRPNAIWQADHTQLNIGLLDDGNRPVRPVQWIATQSFRTLRFFRERPFPAMNL